MKIVIRTAGNEYRMGEVSVMNQWDLVSNLHILGPKFFSKSVVCKSRIEALEKFGHFNDVVDCGYIKFPQ